MKKAHKVLVAGIGAITSAFIATDQVEARRARLGHRNCARSNRRSEYRA
jgi:hypothetical protein